MTTPGGSLDESQFHCSICLELFTDPVTTSCGHNYCKSCIGGYWDSRDVFKCPLCQEAFNRRPELRINTTFREVVNHFQNMTISNEPDAKPGEVCCDICTGRKLRALKSCLVCLTSYCETHLEPHQRLATLKNHKLINPVENLEDWMCKTHQWPLELFCKTDQTFLCQFCFATDHSKHQVITLEMESQLQMAEIQQRIQDRLRQVMEINNSAHVTRVNAERELGEGMKVFTALMNSIEKCQNELIEKITKKQKAEERRAEGLLKDLKLEIMELQRRSTELEQLSHTEDHLHLLQRFSQNCHQSPPRKKLNAFVDKVDFLSWVRQAVCDVQSFVGIETKKLVATELERMQAYAEDITMDPNTAGPWVIISEDGKQVRKSPMKLKVPNNPERFTEDVCVLATQGFSSGRHYWEVEVQNKSHWTVGVAYESVRRKEFIRFSPKKGVLTIMLSIGKGYRACLYPSVPVEASPPPKKLGVFLDHDEGQLSFFNVEAKTHLFTYLLFGSIATVFPFFDTCLRPGYNETTPLVITRCTGL